jgi:hypothetical protein
MHGIVHLLEGDVSNARRAGRAKQGAADERVGACADIERFWRDPFQL